MQTATNKQTKNIYIVQALGWGDVEDAYYNVSAHTTQKAADAKIKALRAEMLEDEYDTTYNVEVLALS